LKEHAVQIVVQTKLAAAVVVADLRQDVVSFGLLVALAVTMI